MMTPATPAATPPATMAMTRRRASFSTWKPLSSQPETTMPVKAPTLMKPAWPRDSSPEMPMTRFREIAITIHAQMGTSWPLSVRDMEPLCNMELQMRKAAVTRPKVMRL